MSQERGGIHVCSEFADQVRGAVGIVLRRSGRLSAEPAVTAGFKRLAAADQEYHQKYDPEFLNGHGTVAEPIEKI